MTKNPFKRGDPVSIARGEGRIVGVVIKTVLARCHIKIGDRVFVDDWHDVERASLADK